MIFNVWNGLLLAGACCVAVATWWMGSCWAPIAVPRMMVALLGQGG